MTTADSQAPESAGSDQHEIVISRTAEPLIEEPDERQITDWLQLALLELEPSRSTQTSIHIVTCDEIAALNLQYRGREKPTNILSFASDTLLEDDRTLLGDLAVCSEIIQREAETYGKPFQARYAHIMIHGLLHLLGYDHVKSEDQSRMEAMEIKLLSEQGITDPYVMGGKP